MNDFRVAIVGSRNLTLPSFDVAVVIDSLLSEMDSSEHVVIVSGGAPGVDSEAIDYAKRLGLRTDVIHADWEKYGKAAGPIRNKELVQLSDKVIALWDGKSKGTKNTIDEALAQRVWLEVIPRD